jgi:hypothetical protein
MRTVAVAIRAIPMASKMLSNFEDDCYHEMFRATHHQRWWQSAAIGPKHNSQK